MSHSRQAALQGHSCCDVIPCVLLTSLCFPLSASLGAACMDNWPASSCLFPSSLFNHCRIKIMNKPSLANLAVSHFIHEGRSNVPWQIVPEKLSCKIQDLPVPSYQTIFLLGHSVNGSLGSTMLGAEWIWNHLAYLIVNWANYPVSASAAICPFAWQPWRGDNLESWHQSSLPQVCFLVFLQQMLCHMPKAAACKLLCAQIFNFGVCLTVFDTRFAFVLAAPCGVPLL